MRHNSRISESYNGLNLPGHNSYFKYASLLPAENIMPSDVGKIIPWPIVGLCNFVPLMYRLQSFLYV